jgi:hypothetical protein
LGRNLRIDQLTCVLQVKVHVSPKSAIFIFSV